MSFLLVAMFVLAAATVLVLIFGIATMARGGEASGRRSQKLMVARVTLQGLALLVLGIIFYLSQPGA